MDALNKLFAKLSISHKLWGGFAIVLTVLAVVVGNTLFSLASIKEKAATVTEEVQPTLIASMELMTELKEASSFMGFFLLTKEESHKTSYHNHLIRIDEKLQILKDTPVAQRSTETQAILADIENKVARFKAYEPRMIQLAETETENFPPLLFANTYLSPLNIEIVQSLSEMVQSEAGEEANEDRKLLFTDIQNLRYTWSNVVNNMRIFVTTGHDDMLSNIRLFIEGCTSLNKKIIDNYGDMLTFEQEEATAGLTKKLTAYAEKIEDLAIIHQGDKARTDAFLLRTEIGP